MELFTVFTVPVVALFGGEVLSPASVSPVSPGEVDGNNTRFSWVHFFPVGAECDMPHLEQTRRTLGADADLAARLPADFNLVGIFITNNY